MPFAWLALLARNLRKKNKRAFVFNLFLFPFVWLYLALSDFGLLVPKLWSRPSLKLDEGVPL